MKKIIGLTFGNCVHVAGTMNYLNGGKGRL